MKNKKRNKINQKLLIVFLIITILLTLGIIITIRLFFINGGNLNKQEHKLYSYVSIDSVDKCGGLIMYDNKKVDSTTLSEDQKLCIAYSNADLKKSDYTIKKLKENKKSNTCTLGKNMIFATDKYEGNECSIKKYKTDKINAMYKTIYGAEISNNVTSFMLDGSNICYLYKGSYYCGLSETFSFTLGNESLIYRTVSSSIEKGNTIEIYDYFLRINNNECYTSFVGNNKNNDCKKNYNAKKKMKYSFLRKYGIKYKHTFKKEAKSDNYIWVSSEPIK